MPNSDRKIALVTGAARGIGAAVAERLASDGFFVIVNYAGSAGAAEEVVAKIKAAGGDAETAQADVSDASAVRQMFDAVQTSHGGIDVLVNNAGVMMLATFAEADDNNFSRQIDVNLKGTFNTLREAAKRLRNGGRVINFSTTVVGLKLESYGVYTATKAAVEAMTSIMAKEMRGRNITVNAVAPGPTATALFLDGKSEDLINRTAKMNPLERLGTPLDIANVVSFLAGPDGGWVNGQVIRVNGGIV